MRGVPRAVFAGNHRSLERQHPRRERGRLLRLPQGREGRRGCLSSTTAIMIATVVTPRDCSALPPAGIRSSSPEPSCQGGQYPGVARQLPGRDGRRGSRAVQPAFHAGWHDSHQGGIAGPTWSTAWPASTSAASSATAASWLSRPGRQPDHRTKDLEPGRQTASPRNAGSSVEKLKRASTRTTTRCSSTRRAPGRIRGSAG